MLEALDGLFEICLALFVPEVAAAKIGIVGLWIDLA